jgi:hypothetical protein
LTILTTYSPACAGLFVYLNFRFAAMRSVVQFALMLMLSTGMLMAQSADEVEMTDNRQVTLPEIGVNFGIVTLMSDVALSSPGPNAFTQFGYQLTISQRLAKFLSLSLNLFTGTVYGEEMRNLTNLNYRTALFSQQINLEYNFYPLLKPDESGRQLLRPYIGFGAGAMLFRSKGDLRDANGETYNYWSDGTIRNLAETNPNAEAAILLERDMVYESDLRDADLDGLRKYPQATFTLPFHAGIRIQLSKNFGVNAAFTYAMNFSDMLDNSGAQSIGDRASSSGNDHHMFGSIGVNVFFGKVRPKAKSASEPQQLAQSVNRWTTKEKHAVKEEVADAAEKPSSKKAADKSAESKGDADSREVTAVLPQVAYKADGTAVELAPRGMAGVDGTPVEQLFDANGNAFADAPVASARLAYRADGKAVELAPSALKGADGTPAHHLFDANGQAIVPHAPSSKRLAYRADGSAVQLVAKGFEGADGTPIAQLMDGQGRPMTNEVAKTALLAYRKDGSAVEVVPQRMETADGTPSAQLFDANGNVLTSEAVSNKVAYKADGSAVVVSYTGMAGADGTPIEQLFDAKGTKLSDETASPSRLAYRTDGTPVEVVAKGVVVADGGSKAPLFDAQGRPLEVIGASAAVVAAGDGATDAATDTAKAKSDVKKGSEKGDKSATPSDKLTLAELEKASPKLSGKFHWADRDNNGYISADEVLFCIDQLFDGNGTLTVESIQELIDFYFDQD